MAVAGGSGRARRAAAIALALVVAASSAAAAAPVRTGLVVLDLPAPALPAATVAAVVTRAAAAAGRGAVVDATRAAAAELDAGARPRDEVARFVAVRAQADEGWRAFLEVAIDFAQARLAKARSDAEELLPLPGGLALYADITLRLGAVLAHAGRADEARDAIRLARALDPERGIGLDEFSPDVLEAVRLALAATPATATLDIAAPAGASVELDGQPRGAGPRREVVTTGQHVVVLRAPGRVARGVAVAVAAGGARVELALDEDRDVARTRAPVPAGLDEASATATIETLQRYGELDEVVVVAVVPRRGELAILGQRCAGGVDRPVQCTAVVEVGFPDPSGLPAAARAAWRDLATGQLRYPLTLSADPRLGRAGGGPADPARCRWCRSPWLWASLSAVLVAAGVTALVATDDGTTTFELGIDPADWTR
ncbi:MAG: hypothetical protein KBG28_28715 [Kofleriaceae bacterium]|jgi:tetratricopeptide (TPR) repeat protein|nr:hypothetical protein [Kofleriaceae bacterium]MBP9207983.1 hypothetical protein [Kofleriaceae bacterium]